VLAKPKTETFLCNKISPIMFNTDHLHPIIVHFPVALIIVGFLFEVAALSFKRVRCLSDAGFYLMILAALAAVAAWSSGHLFTEAPTEGAIVKVYLNHKNGALITMLVIAAGALFRIWLRIKNKEESPLKWIAFGLYLIAFCAVVYTGFKGGSMVYDFMIGLG
jgi:uncharacterized membrane protein